MNPLSVHWIPAHAGGIGGRDDRDWFAAWQPAFVKVVTDDETIPQLDRIPPGAMIVVRNYPLSELGHDRGFTPSAIAGLSAANRAADENARTEGSGRDMLVRGPGAFAHPDVEVNIWDAGRFTLTGITSVPEDVARQHALTCARIADWCVIHGVNRIRLLFEGLNEPMLWSTEPPALVARYYREFLLRLHDHGLRGVCGNFGVGWPGNGGVQDAPVEWGPFKPMIDAMIVTGGRPDYLGLHEYWALDGPAQNWRWWAGRYEQCPYKVPILITECGIDTGVTGHWFGGWGNLPGQMTERAKRYVSELAWYWGKCLADGRIQGIFPFTYDRGSDTWVQFDIRNEDWLRELTGRVAEFPPATWTGGSTDPDPEPDPEPAPNLEEELRNAAWNMLSIPYNPDAALSKAARALNYGVPMTAEFDVIVSGVPYRAQGFAGGIVYARVGDWGNVKQVAW